ncbi:MAG: CBS domain-containing protein [Actinomycetota bacterium]
MSPRAAWRLESLGFKEVYEYRPGKADWSAAGLPLEGKMAAVPRLGQVVRRDVTRAGLKDPVGEVAKRATADGWDTALVVNREGILLGRLYKAQLDGDSNVTAEAATKHGPSTFRPDVDVSHMTKLMKDKDLDTAPVTTSDGMVLGMVLREDLES